MDELRKTSADDFEQDAFVQLEVTHALGFRCSHRPWIHRACERWMEGEVLRLTSNGKSRTAEEHKYESGHVHPDADCHFRGILNEVLLPLKMHNVNSIIIIILLARPISIFRTSPRP